MTADDKSKLDDLRTILTTLGQGDDIGNGQIVNNLKQCACGNDTYDMEGKICCSMHGVIGVIDDEPVISVVKDAEVTYNPDPSRKQIKYTNPLIGKSPISDLLNDNVERSTRLCNLIDDIATAAKAAVKRGCKVNVEYKYGTHPVDLTFGSYGDSIIDHIATDGMFASIVVEPDPRKDGK